MTKHSKACVQAQNLQKGLSCSRRHGPVLSGQWMEGLSSPSADGLLWVPEDPCYALLPERNTAVHSPAWLLSQTAPGEVSCFSPQSTGNCLLTFGYESLFLLPIPNNINCTHDSDSTFTFSQLPRSSLLQLLPSLL